jgi:DNA-binding MarR family transcriptional regulator
LTNTDTGRVIATLRRSPGLKDGELARQAGVEPRLVDQICRYLEILGRLRRAPGPDGEIINTLIDT